MIDWKAVKKAADAPDYSFLLGRGVFDRPLSEEEARAIAASIHARYNNSWGFSPSPSQMSRLDLQFLPDGNGGYTLGGVPVARNNEGVWVYGNGKPVFQAMYFDNAGNRVDAPTPEQINRMEEEAETGKFSQSRPEEYTGILSDKGDVLYNGRGFRYGDLTPELNKRLEKAEEIAADPVRGMAFDEAIRRYGELDNGEDENQFNSIVQDLDPNGYLAKYGITRDAFPGNGANPYRLPGFMLIHEAAGLRGTDSLREYLKTHDIDLYNTMFAEDERREVEKLRRDMLRKENMTARSAKRWGNNQISLTPEQYAYYDAKRQLQANPKSQPHWNAYLKAKQPMTPNDLGQVNKYTVQQRMMNTPQPNGMQKTPAMLQQEWQQENRRRQNIQKDFYNTDRQAGKGYKPTPINTWNY